MKRIIFVSILLSVLAFTANCQPRNKSAKELAKETAQEKIQVAILLDISGSMQGLIEQAKSRLWNIVNTLTTLKYNGKTPEIEIALYAYGSYQRLDGDYMKQITPLTTDLDLISQELFALTADGSEEYCGTVIQKATNKLEWGRNESDMKLIYIAGNEIFEQGKIPYKEAVKNAVDRNIYVNTIHCGNRDMGIRDFWQDAAARGNGKFFNIDSNAKVRYIVTPYDDEIQRCNMRLNDTYIGYGRLGDEKKANQSAQDANASSISSANYAERVVSKSKSVYKNTSWDLVDKYKEDQTVLSNINKKELPKEYQDKTTAELTVIISQKDQERTEIQKEISALAVKRQAYIDEQSSKEEDTGDDLGKAINESILSIAKVKGYAF